MNKNINKGNVVAARVQNRDQTSTTTKQYSGPGTLCSSVSVQMSGITQRENNGKRKEANGQWYASG